MPDKRTFRIQWAYGRTDDVTGDISDAIRQAQATIEAGGEDFEWYDPLVIVDLTTGREFHIPDAVLRLPAEAAARVIGKMEDAAVGGTRLVDLQAMPTCARRPRCWPMWRSAPNQQRGWRGQWRR